MSHCESRYKWLYMGWTLEQRLVYVEEHWAFFLGFGMYYWIVRQKRMMD